MTTTRNTIIRMTHRSSGAVTYVTARGMAKARGKAHAYPDATAADIAAEFAAMPGNADYDFTTEAI